MSGCQLEGDNENRTVRHSYIEAGLSAAPCSHVGARIKLRMGPWEATGKVGAEEMPAHSAPGAHDFFGVF